MTTSKLGTILVQEDVISADQLQEAIEKVHETRGRLIQSISRLGFATPYEMCKCLSKVYKIPFVDLEKVEFDDRLKKLVPLDIAKKYIVLPLKRNGSTLTLAISDPSNVFALDDIKFMTGCTIQSAISTEESIREYIAKFYSKKTAKNANINAMDYDLGDDDDDDSFDDIGGEDDVVNVDDFDSIVKGAVDNVEVVEDASDEDIGSNEAEDAPIVKLVNGILIKAIKLGVSDIHIEPYEKSFRVRYRLDGHLKKVMGLPLKIKNAIISRIKIMSKLDIAERRLPQDGRIKMKLGKKKDMDFRVSVLPCLFGEKVVMRLLDKSNLQLDMTKLGFEKKSLEIFQTAINKPYGMILVTGPTGSGKTTTLYSALNQVNDEGVNIMTAEDPVEFNLMGINQVQVREQIGLTFASALRSFLRQDPDIVMVGEIRDFETAEIAIKAALTGHLVFSTLHTNDAPQTINRLLNMGIEPFLVASSVLLIVAQRLIRKLCEKCKEEADIPLDEVLGVGFSSEEAKSLTFYKSKGCDICAGTGYKGRLALYEVLEITENIRNLVLRGAAVSEIREAAIEDGMLDLRASGLQKVREGITSIEEIVKVTVG